MAIPLYIIIGATASGKEKTAVALAEKWQAENSAAEIVVVDSMKIYRGLDIGTAKPSPAIRAKIKHHGLDLISPEQNFSAAEYAQTAAAAIAEINRQGKRVIMVGGAAFYYKALLEGLCETPATDWRLREELAALPPEILYARLCAADPRAAAKIHQHDQRRMVRALEVIELTNAPFSDRQTQWQNFYSPNDSPENSLPAAAAVKTAKIYEPHFVLLNWERNELRARIAERVEQMLADGLVMEAKMVFERRDLLARTPLQAVGYKEFFPYFSGEISLAEAVAQLKTHTCQLAKSQMTWFRKFPAQWLDLSAAFSAPECIARELKFNQK